MVKSKLTTKQKSRIREWVRRLRSGKWHQAQDQLAKKDKYRHVSYCCLGVAEKQAIDSGVEGCALWGTGSLSIPSSSWVGLGTVNPMLKVPSHLQKKAGSKTFITAVVLNDLRKFSFKQIADCIEFTYLPDDWKKTLKERKVA